jgi:hypothetical protein
VGSIAEGEWLEYTLDTVAPGTYSIAVKTSGTSSPGSKVTLNIDGTMLGSITIPGTGNGQTWEQVILGGVPIAGGKTQVLRVAMNGSLFNIDNITFTRSSSGTITAKAGANQTITDTDKNGSQAVTLDGSGSTATGTSIASYTWKEGSVELATGAKPTVTLTVGIHIVTLTIASSEGFSTSDTVTIEVKAASTATGRYFMSESTLVTINKPSNVDFRTVMNSNGYIFPKAFDESTITALNTWANQLLATNPFAGLASNQVPYINLSDNVNKDGSYAFITQEQMAYLFLISIF